MFPFTNPMNGNPFQNFGGNQQGQQGQQGQQMNGFQNPFGSWQQGFPFNTEQLQKQISDTISNSLPDFMRSPTSPSTTPSKTSHSTQVDVFETHDFVVARIPVTDQQAKPKLSLDTTKLYIKGLPGNDDLTVPLPSPIKPKYTKAEFKSGVLEVRMLKKGPEPMTDITIEG